ncbi:hypothetical protein [Desulfonatronum thioautotrophicum]|uniref:hypothetical protein n=1 Tax=Desulfonatronum thioautotrophicum TaxID=617001 RepID=UPI000699CC33|nr:hypothetical protein [Desulfonatronum thioautotrophicum]
MTAPICLPSLLARRFPRLAGRMPKLGWRMLERLAHVPELNRHLRETEHLPPRQALRHILRDLQLDVYWTTTTGQNLTDLLPNQSRITLCANHPYGAAEALVLLHLLSEHYGTVRVPANSLLQELSSLAPFFFPIDKHGSSRKSLRELDALFAGDDPILVFPAGTTGRPRQGRITGPVVDFPWTKTFLKKSRQHGRLLIPVHVRGRNSCRFYTLARIRTSLGIRANLEMLLLADELMRKRGTTLEAVVGPPIDPRHLGPNRTDTQWVELLREYVQDMKPGMPGDFLARGAHFLGKDTPQGGDHHGMGCAGSG